MQCIHLLSLSSSSSSSSSSNFLQSSFFCISTVADLTHTIRNSGFLHLFLPIVTKKSFSLLSFAFFRELLLLWIPSKVPFTDKSLYTRIAFLCCLLSKKVTIRADHLPIGIPSPSHPLQPPSPSSITLHKCSLTNFFSSQIVLPLFCGFC